MERSRNFYKTIRLGYILISVLIGCIAYNSFYEWQEIEALELDNKKIDEFRKEINNINIQMIKFSLFGETILEWNDKDIEHYHAQRMAMDSMLCRFKATYPAERIDSVRHLLEDKERQMCQIVQILEQQQAINDKIPRQVPVIAQKSVQEQPKKPKRKGFLGIFGKKEEAKPTVTTTMHRSFNRNMRTEQQAQSRRLSVHADSLAARNAELNRQLQGLVVQIDGKVQTDLQKREAEITAMRERSFIQIGGLTGFVILLLVISYIIIHRNANRIKRYKQETADLIERLQQMAKRNEALIASRKKAVHTITHELRTPLTAITGYAGLMRKDCNTDKTGTYIRNIQESSDRMREMLNTLLNFFRLDNGKEQPNFSACRISAITHTLETEFMPIAINKGLTLTIHCHKDAFVCTDKERILQIGNNLLSNAIKFTENGSVSLRADYDNGLLKLIVEDTGTGMTEEEQQRVFGAFERLSNAAAKDGFGLGLSIVQRIVTMLGGTIRLESDKGKGSRFTVEIPMQTAEELPERINQTQVHHNHTFHDVVAIDNDEVLLLMLKEMYAQEGIHCDTCTNAATAIASGVGSLFGSGKLKELEHHIEQLHQEITKRDKATDELKIQIQQIQEQHSRQIRNLQRIHNQELEAKDKEISRLSTLLEKAHKWFPMFKEMLRMEKLCAVIGFTKDMIENLLTKKESIQCSGKIYSEEHRWKFDIKNDIFRVEKHPMDSGKLMLTINRQPIVQWFKEQWEKLQQNLRNSVQREQKSRGFRI